MARIDPDQLVKQAREEVPVLTVAEAGQQHADGAQFIDVREPQEWLTGYIDGALHIPRGTLEFEVGSHVPNPRRRLVTYCSSGGRAALAAQQLRRLGYRNAMAMDGGYSNWKEAGYPRSRNPIAALRA